MRVFTRFALVLVVLAAATPLLADVFRAECPMTLVASNPPSTNFGLSPHGSFRFGNQVFVLRGQSLTTYTVNDLGDLQIAREDFIGTMAARESNGGTTFNNGYLYVSSEAGLEVFDLRAVRVGGQPPSLISRTAGLHYRRLAANRNLLAGVYPATDMPCAANGLNCANSVDIFDVTNPAAPVRVSSIGSGTGAPRVLGFNDVTFNNDFLIATGLGGTVSYNVTSASSPQQTFSSGQPGTFLVSNGTNLVGVGNDTSVLIYNFDGSGGFSPSIMENLNASLAIDRINPIMFHPQATFDTSGTRLITMVDELDPLSLKPARTIAFDVFDFGIPQFEGSDPRIYETISWTTPDEVKWNPVAVGPYVYTVGELSGLQTWGACGLMAGKIELDNVTQLNCNGAEIHGWVTGASKIVNVEVLLDSGSLGTVTVGGLPRTDISSRTPVFTWRATVNLDQTTRGDHVMKLIATDALGNRRQVASQRMFFPGPGQNCASRRRVLATHF